MYGTPEAYQVTITQIKCLLKNKKTQHAYCFEQIK